MLLDIHVKKYYDDYPPDTSWLGHFSDQWQPEAIRVQPYWRGYRNWETRDLWYHPAESIRRQTEWFTKNGYSKHDAAMLPLSYAHQDKERLLAYYRDDWYFMGITVVIRYNGIELGSASCGGIESDGGDEYLAEITQELIDEALAEVKANYEAVKSLTNIDECEKVVHYD